MSNSSLKHNVNDVFGSEFIANIAELSAEKPVPETVVSQEPIVDKKELKKQFIAESVRLIQNRNAEGLKELYKKPRSFTINSRVLDIRSSLLNCFDSNVADVLKEHGIELYPNEVKDALATNFNKELFDYIEKDITIVDKIYWINEIMLDSLMGKDKGADSVVCLEHLYPDEDKEFILRYKKERMSFSPYNNIVYSYNSSVPQRLKNFCERYFDEDFLENVFDSYVFKSNVLYCSDVGVSNMFAFLKDFPVAQKIFLEMNEKYNQEDKMNITLIRDLVDENKNQNIMVEKSNVYGNIKFNDLIQQKITEHNFTVLPRFHSILSIDLSFNLKSNGELLLKEDYRKIKGLVNRFAFEAHRVLHVLWKSEDGRKKFVESFDNELIRKNFFKNASLETLKKVLRLPEFKNWKDEDDNTLLHYLVVFARYPSFDETMNVLKIHCQNTEQKNKDGISVEELFLRRHNIYNENDVQKIQAELVKTRLNKSLLPQKRTSDVAKKRKM